jgi:hypothetical protein
MDTPARCLAPHSRGRRRRFRSGTTRPNGGRCPRRCNRRSHTWHVRVRPTRAQDYRVSGIKFGFSVFVLEVPPLANTSPLSEYVLQRRGDAASALSILGAKTRDTKETLDLIEWMRRHNQGATDARKVRFFGLGRIPLENARSGLRSGARS